MTPNAIQPINELTRLTEHSATVISHVIWKIRWKIRSKQVKQMQVARMIRSTKDDRRVDKMNKIYLMIHFEVLQTFVPIVNQII